MSEEFKKRNRSEDAIEQLEMRAREKLDDTDETFLTAGDKAFFYMTSAKLYLCSHEIAVAEDYAKRAFELNRSWF